MRNCIFHYYIMPRRAKTVRRRAPIRGAYRQRRLRRVRREAISNGLGGFYISRRMNSIYLTNDLAGGAMNNSNALVVTLGPPEQVLPASVDTFNVPFAFNFSLKQLLQFTDITAICDRYKIVGATVKFSYNANTAWGSAAGATGGGLQQANFMPIVNYVQDYDDDGVQTVQQLLARQGLKQRVFKNGNSQVVIKVAPRPAAQIYDGATAAFAIPNRPQWINTGYPDVPHYGIKGYLQNVGLASIANYYTCFTVDVTLKIACKDLQ